MSDKIALLLVDVQQAFDEPVWGARNNPDAEQNIAKLVGVWRQRELPLIHIQHCSSDPDSPLREGKPGNAFKPEAAPNPGETVFQKSVNSAFIGTGLTEHLKHEGIEQLVVVGFTTDHCVSTTVRMAANLGFTTTLLSDATATFERAGVDGTHHDAESIHQIHLASLSGEFCTVVTTARCLLDLA